MPIFRPSRKEPRQKALRQMTSPSNMEIVEKTIAIVGRPNVGKSALFNRLLRKQISLVFDRPGVTRDRLVATCQWRNHVFSLIDTGGIGLEDKEGFGDAITREVDLALEAASDILMVVDGREGLTPLDREVAQRLRKARRPVHVVVNKLDDEKVSLNDAEFSALGLGPTYGVSAAHGIGIDDLMDSITKDWPEVEPQERPANRPAKIAIVGRPNVGKSSLINALLEEQRTMVSDIPGTTRDAVDIPFRWKDSDYVLIDTAGLRQERRIKDTLEASMSGRTAHTINRADICVLVIDATTGVSMQDKKIAGLIQEAHCPCVIVVNKWDIARDQGDAGKVRERAYYDSLTRDLFFLSYAPVIFLSAKTGERLKGLFQMIEMIEKNRHFRFQTGPLNRVLNKAQEKYAPPLVRGKRVRIYYAAQQTVEGKREIPNILCFVNSPDLMTPAYERYLELQIRESFDLRGCPIRLHLKARAQEDRTPKKRPSNKR